MISLKSFEEFLEENIVKKQRVDLPRAKSLVEEAEKRKFFLKEMFDKIKISNNNANYFVENAYDVMIEMIRAKLLLDGFNASGNYAHEAEISYLKKLNFPEAEIRLANELRYFRNGIKYYGKRYNTDYAHKVLEFLDEIYPKLKQIIKIY